MIVYVLILLTGAPHIGSIITTFPTQSACLGAIEHSIATDKTEMDTTFSEHLVCVQIPVGPSI